MCRFAAYIGQSSLSLSAILYDPPHSLEEMAYAPLELLDGQVNVDGTGAAWWTEGNDTPLRYVTTGTPWSDPNLALLAPTLSGNPMLAAVRNATPGIGHGIEHVQPLATGRLAVVHNGWIGGFREGVGRTLIAGLSDDRFAELDVFNDSLVIALMVADRVAAAPGTTLMEAVTEAIATVAKAVSAVGSSATLNLAVASRDEIVATRTSVGYGLNSLYVAEDDGFWLASEPLDDARKWRPVPDHSTVRLDGSSITVSPLEHIGVP